MGEERAAAVFTDPPYNLRIQNVSGLGAVHHREFAMASGEMDEVAFAQFLQQACTLLAKYSRDGSLHYICRLIARFYQTRCRALRSRRQNRTETLAERAGPVAGSRFPWRLRP